jgi:tetratricopeptide (TPR) repeat protein
VQVARPLVMHGEAKLRDRFFELLLRRDPGSLTALAANGNVGLADAALNYTVAHGTQAQALAAVGNRGKALHPVWRPASASLVETYFASAAPSAVRVADFNESLAANSTIGMRLGAPADPARQLTGDSYFYYASRFGIYLSTVRDPAQRLPDAEDFLPAELEGSPATPEGYLNLARSYVEAHNIAAAVEEYGHALELSPSDAAIEDELAATLYRVHRHDEALAHWTQSLTILGDMQRQGTYPESWFKSLATISRHLGEYHQWQLSFE